MASTAHGAFTANRRDIGRLDDIHGLIAGTHRGRKREVEVLNKSAIVLVCACWEAYVEDVLTESLHFMAQAATQKAQLPLDVTNILRTAITQNGTAHDVTVWDSEQPGWQALLQREIQAVTGSDWIKKLHTPKTQQVVRRFEVLLDLNQLQLQWRWRKMSSTVATQKLDTLVSVRGDIAHRTRHTRAVHKNWVTLYLNHVARLVDKTDEVVCQHLLHRFGTAPW